MLYLLHLFLCKYYVVFFRSPQKLIVIFNDYILLLFYRFLEYFIFKLILKVFDYYFSFHFSPLSEIGLHVGFNIWHSSIVLK